jgi:O-antigen/teichoic acid export membrane protein
LYIEDNKKQLILYRLLAQIATLAGVILFYFHYINSFYITIIQAAQTLILSFGTYFAARKYIPGHFNVQQLLAAARSITFKSISENLNYFLLRNFITFFTTIEAVILAQKGMTEERNMFTEGMRLSGVLAPFVLFYINFNINKIKEGYYTRITLIAIGLLLVSPLYVMVFFGEGFSQNIYYYNYFLWVFIFNAFIEKDYIELLTSDNTRKRTLLIYNLCYFAASVVLLGFLFQTGMPLLWIILLFSFKLLIYYLVLIRMVRLKLRYTGVISAFLAMHVINYLLHTAGYYTWLFQQIAPLKHYFFKR